MSHHRALQLAWICIFLLASFNFLFLPAPSLAMPAAQSPAAEWKEAREHGGIVYLLYPAELSTIKRYDLSVSAWLPDLTFPRLLNAFNVDADGLYLAEAKSIYHANLDGTDERPLFNINPKDDSITSLHPFGNHLLVNVLNYQYPYSVFISLQKATGQQISRFSSNYKVLGISIAHNQQALAGRMSSDVFVLPLRSDGTFGVIYDSPYHGDYPYGSRVWFSPNDALVVDGGGIIYNTAQLTFHAALDRKVQDAVFSGETLVILNSGTIYSYDSRFLAAARYRPADAPSRIFLHGTSIFAFHSTETGPTVEEIPLTALQPAVPAEAVDPAGFAYAADQVEIGSDETVYLLHKASRNILRWSTSTRQYLSSIPLIDTPICFALDKAENSLYVAYSGGLYSPGSITRIRLNDSIVEQPFANLPYESGSNMTMVGDYLLTAYLVPANAFVTFTIFDRSGTVTHQREFGIYSSEYTWNPAKTSIYFASDFSSDVILYQQPIVSGIMREPYKSLVLASERQMHPIRVNASGTVIVIGDGRIIDGEFLSHVGSLAGPVADGVFTVDDLYTLHGTSNGSQVQRWNSNNNLVQNSPELAGTPKRLLQVQGGFVVVTIYNGKTRLSILDQDLNLLATPPLISGIVATPQSGAAPLEVQFNAPVSLAQTPSFSWNFGDGRTSTDASPTHTYAHNGSYDVRLIVSSAGGEDVFLAEQLVVVNSTTADFTATPFSGISPLKVQFTNLTNGTVFDSIYWDFGDGETSAEKDPIHTYTTPGSYAVSLTMSGPGGTDTESRTNYIHAYWGMFLPVVRYQYEIFTRPGTYSFNKCQSFTVYSDRSSKVLMTECVESVEAQEDGNLKFNFSWRATFYGSYYGCLTKQTDLNNHKMYIKNQDGLVYHFKRAGGSAGQIECMEKNRTYSGWFLFPPVINRSTVYTFQDDNNNVAIEDLNIPLK